jgi:carbonic anhydrase
VRANALCDINVIEQVVNVSVSTVMVDAWARGQDVTVHGWAFGVHDGLLQDLQMTVASPDQLDGLYREAVDRVWDIWKVRAEERES